MTLFLQMQRDRGSEFVTRRLTETPSLAGIDVEDDTARASSGTRGAFNGPFEVRGVGFRSQMWSVGGGGVRSGFASRMQIAFNTQS